MHIKTLSAICFNLGQSKILSSGNGLNGLFNSLPNDQILDLPKFTVFADVKSNMNKKLKLVLDRV